MNTFSEYNSCSLCPRGCSINRNENKTGYCKQNSEIKAARAALHFWEEPCISGTSGSGTVFFSGCTLGCVFCQNEKIAKGNIGKTISVERLTEIFLELQEKGANNINLVTAGHFQPSVADALEDAKAKGLVLPIVYNTSSYESLDTIKSLDGLVDIYLPDLKYISSELSRRYSRAENYFEVACQNIREMVRQTGEPLFRIKPKHMMQESYEMWESEAALPISASEYNEICDMDEETEILMQRGTIVRHLLLPGCVEDSKRVIGYLLDTYGDKIYISIMNQFTPLKNVSAYPELNRKVTETEYDEVINYAINQGIENAFIQEGDVAEESFIPDFSYEGL